MRHAREKKKCMRQSKKEKEVHRIWEEHTMCSITKKAQAREKYKDKMSGITH